MHLGPGTGPTTLTPNLQPFPAPNPSLDIPHPTDLGHIQRYIVLGSTNTMSTFSMRRRCDLWHSATALNEFEIKREGGSAQASRSAMQWCATHLYRPFAQPQERPAQHARPGCPATPGGGPPPLSS